MLLAPLNVGGVVSWGAPESVIVPEDPPPPSCAPPLCFPPPPPEPLRPPVAGDVEPSDTGAAAGSSPPHPVHIENASAGRATQASFVISSLRSATHQGRGEA